MSNVIPPGGYQYISGPPAAMDISPYDPDNEITDGEIMEDQPTVYAVDAVTGDVYHGILSDPLTEAYESRERIRAAHASTNRDGKRAILGRAEASFNRQNGTHETYWYPVDCAMLPPGAIPGEYKWLHLTSEV